MSRKTPQSLQKDCGVLRFGAAFHRRGNPTVRTDAPAHAVRLTWRGKGLCSSLHMKTISASVLGLVLALTCAWLSAEPAPWFKWRSKLDGTLACSQTPLGPGWDQVAGAYRDSRCEKRIAAK
jgi:hypothetical protein